MIQPMWSGSGWIEDLFDLDALGPFVCPALDPRGIRIAKQSWSFAMFVPFDGIWQMIEQQDTSAAALLKWLFPDKAFVDKQ